MSGDLDLPDHPSCTGLLQAIGAEALGRLSLALAGKRVYVPRAPNAILIQAIGPDAAAALCAAYGGEQIEVPVTLGRLALIHDLRRRQPDLSISQIAQRLRISRRTVTRALAGRDPTGGTAMRSPGDGRQMDLFG